MATTRCYHVILEWEVGDDRPILSECTVAEHESLHNGLWCSPLPAPGPTLASR
jgi:hypothetical protein